MLEVRDVTVRFGDRTVLDRVTLDVAGGETVALLGPSGSGKSTLLRVIAGIVAPDAGAVVIDGAEVTDIPTHRRNVGMVFQHQQLFPHLTVSGNIGFGLDIGRVGRDERRRRVDEMLELVGMTGFGGRRVDRLSGGERTRVALARSLAPRPTVLLLDEPLTGLDRALHDNLEAEVRNILAASEITAVWVTHDPEEATTMATRVARLDSTGRLFGAAGHVVDLRSEQTHPLRRSVLRGGALTADVEFDGDDLATTFHLGFADAGALVAVSTWIARAYPDRPEVAGVQLRGMATEPSHRGSGVGAALLAAGFDRCRRAGVAVVWARARDTALDFYLRHGFVIAGRGYTDLTTGLAHHDIVIEL